MLADSIKEFFEARKSAWIKKSVKASMSDVEVRKKEIECEELFSLEQWLPKAAQRAKSRAISSHPSKFSHPSTGIGKDNRKNATYVTPVICASAGNSLDGYLRSGNVEVVLDSLGNAGELDVDEFLRLVVTDKRTVLEHLIDDSVYAKQLFSISTESYETLRSGFLAMVSPSEGMETSSKIKQIYFPVDESYHLLSTLTPSGLIFELKKRCRLSECEKIAKSKRDDGEFSKEGYSRVVNITAIGYGGANPWNISEINKNNYGVSYLMLSEPPKLSKYETRFPTTDFFGQIVSHYQCKDLFYALHELFLNYKNDWNVRIERDEYYHAIVDRIIEKMWLVRSVCEAQYNPDTSQLSKNQKIWLCAANEGKREIESDWLVDLCNNIARFIFNGYEKLLGKKAFMFSDAEFKHILKQVVKNKEALR